MEVLPPPTPLLIVTLPAPVTLNTAPLTLNVSLAEPLVTAMLPLMVSAVAPNVVVLPPLPLRIVRLRRAVTVPRVNVRRPSQRCRSRRR